ncbi:MAG: putative nucleotidyltransferase substrate binding domain-containing protein [Rubricoccaceae bacterium]
MAAPSMIEQLLDLLARTAPFDTLSDDERRRIVGSMTLEIYEPGEVILNQGEDVHRALYIVQSGVVRLVDAETNRLIDMVGDGSQFGSYGLVQGGALPYEARAVEHTVCALVAAEQFRRLRKEHPEFKVFFDEDVKRYVRGLDADRDASGAFLLFDTRLGELLHRGPATVPAGASVREAARALAAASADAVVVVQDETPVGVVTEGDLVARVLAAGTSPEAPIMSLVDRPPIALRSDERLFSAMRTMMHYRIRRLVVMDPPPEEGQPARLRGLLTADDISHFRGLDPVATTERLERADSVEELAELRAESNRRLFRLYSQGVQSEDLLGVVAEVDDHLKQRLLALVERDVRAGMPEAERYDGPWAFLVFGAAGRREAALRAWQDNGLVYADPAPEDAARAAAYYARLAEAVTDALAACGYDPPEHGITARAAPFRQPLAAWRAAFDTWAAGADAESTARAAACFDLRVLHGEEGLGDALREAIAAHVPGGRLPRILAREGTRLALPLTLFGSFELDRAEDGSESLDLRARGLQPVVRLARALALDTGYVRSASTFARLRHVAESGHPLAEQARRLLPAFGTLVDLHLRGQMQAAEIGAAPTDRLDPDRLHRSQQNLLKETFKTIRRAQEAARKHYDLS